MSRSRFTYKKILMIKKNIFYKKKFFYKKILCLWWKVMVLMRGGGCQNKACYDKMTVLTKMTFFMIFYVFFCLWENALSVSFGWSWWKFSYGFALCSLFDDVCVCKKMCEKKSVWKKNIFYKKIFFIKKIFLYKKFFIKKFL